MRYNPTLTKLISFSIKPKPFCCAEWVPFSASSLCLMDQQARVRNRQWKVLCWNVRGSNAIGKWTAIRSKIKETNCDIICLQESKREFFDHAYLRNFCSSQFDSFDYVPSIGLSGGTIVIWKSSRFLGQTIFQNDYAMSIEFTSTMSGASWVLTNIYAPCTTDGKQQFLDWLHNVDMPDDCDWLLVGDFNLIRRPTDRNRTGGNVQEMLGFNNAISNLRLQELNLIGSKFTWTNKQASPLLERLDWFFGSVSWFTNYLGTVVKTLSRDTSDHTPCIIEISSDIPKARVFRFGNYWLLHNDFMEVMNHGWNVPTAIEDKAKKLGAKLKNLRRVLRAWHSQLSNLAATIENNKLMLFLLDNMELQGYGSRASRRFTRTTKGILDAGRKT
jgi:exonuclease III